MHCHLRPTVLPVVHVFNQDARRQYYAHISNFSQIGKCAAELICHPKTKFQQNMTIRGLVVIGCTC